MRLRVPVLIQSAWKSWKGVGEIRGAKIAPGVDTECLGVLQGKEKRSRVPRQCQVLKRSAAREGKEIRGAKIVPSVNTECLGVLGRKG